MGWISDEVSGNFRRGFSAGELVITDITELGEWRVIFPEWLEHGPVAYMCR
jgi:hypothetical protein